MESQYHKEKVLETLSQERDWKLWKRQVYCMLTLQLKKLKFFVISERELFIITSSCERLRTGDDWCEFMTDTSSLSSHLVVRVSEIFFFVQISVLL